MKYIPVHRKNFIRNIPKLLLCLEIQYKWNKESKTDLDLGKYADFGYNTFFKEIILL